MSVLFHIIEFLLSPAENALILYFVVKYFGFKDDSRFKRAALVFVLLSMVLLARMSNHFSVQQSLFLLMAILVLWIYSRWALNGGAIIQLLFCFIPFILLPLYTTLVLQGMVLSMQISADEIMAADSYPVLWMYVISRLMLYVSIEIVLQVMKKDKLHLKLKERLTLIIVFLVSFIIAIGVYEIVRAALFDESLNFKAMLLVLGIIIIDFYIYYAILSISKEHQSVLYTELTDLKNKELENQLLQFKDVKKKEEKMWHDYKNHLMCLKTLLQEREHEAAEAYIDELSGFYIQVLNRVDVSNNPTINAVVHSKGSICKEKGIRLDVKAAGDFSMLDGVDSSVILFNLLDNAIEAVEDTDEKYISLELKQDKSYINIFLTNPIKGSVLRENPNLIFSRKKYGSHGLGHLNVEDAVQRNGGMVEYYEERGQFVAHVLLKTSAGAANDGIDVQKRMG